jgi:hypothetical protein
MRNTQLGMSMGIKTKTDPEATNMDLDDILNKKLSKIQKRGSSPDPVEKKIDVEIRSSLATQLLKNSVKNRIVGQLKDLMQ